MDLQQKKIIADIILTPFAYLFRIGVGIRNVLFNQGILKQHKFDVPVVVVGNIAVGGTGKTPHTEYIVGMLCSQYHIGVLSRGYKRKTKGFVLASDNLSSAHLGDEPYQIYRKFSNFITLAVCDDRVEGIKQMLKIDPSINLFVLDDAFQHRYVKPKVAVVLTEYKHLPCDDNMLPLGNLREPMHALTRADMVIVTKCPMDLKPIDVNVIQKKLNLSKWQQIYFSTYQYKHLTPVFNNLAASIPDLEWLTPNDTLLVFTGVANPIPMVKYLKRTQANVKVIHFSDHHDYTRDDFDFIDKTFRTLTGSRKFIVTTEKDAVRIINNPYFPHFLKTYLQYLPIEVKFLNCGRNFSENEFIDNLKAKIGEQ